MSSSVPYAAVILGELDKLIGSASELPNKVDSFADKLMQSNRVFVAGAGRSGLMGKAFAMRLMHLGIQAFVVGETITPAISSSDTLVLGSGSGETGSLIGMADRAKRIGASVMLVTVNPESTLALMSDSVAALPAASKEASSASTVQPMGSLFEQGLLLFYDAIVLKLMELKQLRGDVMYGNHANLE
ncbi:6-phospho-3-hexuloisomerase [Cohnella thailandensis]|uniref:6-phospho-3-hexuloisomerase n=1 Tax=Cohnella thailandensis TaxID=557557 RepID=A0A841T6U1_9BACL|nr:6-phospho-3-hexuloisomerase [Cohnella thailandensis]MBB6638435.1 6-phospho-3-hexuloisomerase [Cohnella thailandensis]MBP1977087.1 6-phospho-3-hexuloisomerase [Cohnella thailandensis]